MALQSEVTDTVWDEPEQLLYWVKGFRRQLFLTSKPSSDVSSILRSIDLDFVSADSAGNAFIVTLSERDDIHSFMQHVCFQVIPNLQDGAPPTREQVDTVETWSYKLNQVQTTKAYDITLMDTFERDRQRGMYCAVFVEQALGGRNILVGISKLVYRASKTYDPVNRTRCGNRELRSASRLHMHDLAYDLQKQLTPSLPSIWTRIATQISNITRFLPLNFRGHGDDFSQSHARLEDKSAAQPPFSITNVINSSLRSDNTKVLQDTTTTVCESDHQTWRGS